MNTFAWPNQWQEVTQEERIFLEQELSREIIPGHILFGLPIRAIARREDCDDVVFAIVGSAQVAEAHLVYGGRASHSDWPLSVLYQSLSEWQKKQVKT